MHALLWFALLSVGAAAVPEEVAAEVDRLEAGVAAAYQERDWAAAEAIIRQQLALLESVEEPDLLVAQTVGNLAFFLEQQGEREQAIPLYESALEIADDVVPGDPAVVEPIIYNLADAIEERDGYEAAIPYWERNLMVCRQLGVGTESWSWAVEVLAGAVFEVGRVAHAQRLLEDALAEVGDEGAPAVRASLQRRLGRVLKDLGDYDAARPWYEAALAAVVEAQPESLEHAYALNDLAVLEHQARDLDRAQGLLMRAEAIYRAHPGQSEMDLSSTLLNLAIIDQETASYEAAEARYQEALEIDARRIGADSLSYSKTLHSYGNMLRHAGRYEASRDALIRALDIRERLLQATHPDVCHTLLSLATLEYLADNEERAAVYAKRALAGVERNLDLLVAKRSDRQRIALRRVFRQTLDGAIRYLEAPAEQKELLEAVVRDRLRTSRLIQQRRIALRAHRDPDTQALWDDLQGVASQLAGATLSGVEPDALRALASRRDELEQAVMERLELDVSDTTFDLEDLCAFLDADTVAIEVARAEWQDATDKAWLKGYVAWVVDPSCNVERVELGPAKAMDAAVAGARASLQDAGGARRGLIDPDVEQDTAEATLKQLFVEPLLAVTGDRHRWIVAADGALATAPVSALRDGERFLLDDLDVIHVPTVGAWGRQGSGAAAQRGLVVGGVAFDGAAGDAATRGSEARATCAPRSFPALPGTEIEAQRVRKRLGRVLGREHVVSLAGGDAAEHVVAQSMAGARIVHLATHGFFAPATCTEGGEWSPMGRSGLVLAGANTSDRQSQADGLLTAEEVALLDLRGTELVVLSACETGLGEVVDGEGVLGLRRAFVDAGAEAVVFSMWPVDDAATTALMTDFYRYLSRSGDPVVALHDAQRRALARQRRRGEVDPSTWGAFVITSTAGVDEGGGSR